MKGGPSRLLLKQAENLFPDEAERTKFIEALTQGNSREPAILVVNERPEVRLFPRVAPMPWQPSFAIRIDEDFRPAKHPLHAKGVFYSLDFSSVFSASVLTAVTPPARRILDLCASPGGKSIFAWLLFQPEILVCNESIRKRMGALISNLHRCGIERSVVWSADPSVYANKFPETFDLILVDAPCSGQSLLAKGDEAPGCFSPTMIDMNVGRQRRITGHAVRCLRPGGHLFYSTCTYSIKENEKVMAWLMQEYPDLEAVEVPGMEEHRSPYAEFPCYRLFPQSQMGAGAFACLLRLKGTPEDHWPSLEELRGSWRFGDPAPERPATPKETVTPEPFKKPKAHGSAPRPKPRWTPRPKPAPGGRRGRRRN